MHPACRVPGECLAAVEGEIIGALKQEEMDFCVALPCTMFKDLLAMMEEHWDVLKVTREEEGVGICAGAYLAGKKPFMVIQNSGLGNSVNALMSLNRNYDIPLLILVSHRGMEGERIRAQKPMGMATRPLLRALGIPYFGPSKADVMATVRLAASRAFEHEEAVCVLFSRKVMLDEAL